MEMISRFAKTLASFYKMIVDSCWIEDSTVYVNFDWGCPCCNAGMEIMEITEMIEMLKRMFSVSEVTFVVPLTSDHKTYPQWYKIKDLHTSNFPCSTLFDVPGLGIKFLQFESEEQKAWNLEQAAKKLREEKEREEKLAKEATWGFQRYLSDDYMESAWQEEAREKESAKKEEEKRLKDLPRDALAAFQTNPNLDW